MIYIFEVRDDEMCSLPCKEFNKFADAFDYAQDGLTTRIFQVPVEDGCEPCYDECKCVWDWSTPEDKDTLVRLFDGCSPSPICEDVADKNDLDARLQAEYKRRLAKYADLFGYDSGEELEDAMNEDGDLYDEVVATDDGDNFLYLYSFYPDTDKEWENDIDDYYEQPLEDVLIGVLEDAENKRGPVQEKLTVDELRDLAEPSIEESPEYWDTIERDKAMKSIKDFDDDIDDISDKDLTLDDDMIVEGLSLDQFKELEELTNKLNLKTGGALQKFYFKNKKDNEEVLDTLKRCANLDEIKNTTPEEFFNTALIKAKAENKPVIYGYANKKYPGKFYSVPLKSCEDPESCATDIRKQYGANVVYVAYPDKNFVEAFEDDDISDEEFIEAFGKALKEKHDSKLNEDNVEAIINKTLDTF